MRTFHQLSVLFFLSTWAVNIPAADLTKIDRTIAKEPVYKGQPKYCLLVFGAEAKHRAWLIMDDEALYVDRNGNGNLTENEKRIPRTKFINGAVRVGILDFGEGKRYTNLILSGVTLEIQGKYRQRAGRDAQGDLAFAAKPQDAPVIHFDGPLAFDQFDYCHDKPAALVRGNKPGAFAVSVGTHGLGKGTFAYFLPPSNFDFNPLAEFQFGS